MGALGGPESWEMQKDTLLLVENHVGIPFLAPQKQSKSAKNASQITKESMKNLQNWSENDESFGEFHQSFNGSWCFGGALGGPESWRMQKDTLLLVENDVGTPFLAPQKHSKSLKMHPKTPKNS